MMGAKIQNARLVVRKTRGKRTDSLNSLHGDQVSYWRVTYMQVNCVLAATPLHLSCQSNVSWYIPHYMIRMSTPDTDQLVARHFALLVRALFTSRLFIAMVDGAATLQPF